MANQLVNTFVIIGSKEGFRRIGSATSVAPFASITWSRFNGSPALPRRTLSLCPGSSGPVGSPQDDRKLSWTAKHVKNSSTRQQQGFTKICYATLKKFSRAAHQLRLRQSRRPSSTKSTVKSTHRPRKSGWLPGTAAALRQRERRGRKKLLWLLDKLLIAAHKGGSVKCDGCVIRGLRIKIQH